MKEPRRPFCVLCSQAMLLSIFLFLSLQTDWKAARVYALMSCIYAELNISFGTAEERERELETKFFSASRGLPLKREPSLISSAGSTLAFWQCVVSWPAPKTINKDWYTKVTKILHFSGGRIQRLTANPNWLDPVINFNNVEWEQKCLYVLWIQYDIKAMLEHEP